MKRILVGVTVVLSLSSGVAALFAHSDRSRSGGQGNELSSPGTGFGSESAPRIKALGRLEPGEGVVNVGGTNGNRINRLMVTEGQRVEAGHILAHLDGEEECRASLKQAQAQFQDGKNLLAAETANGEAAIREAEIAVTRARTISTHEIEGQKAQVQIYKDRVVQYQDDLMRYRRLLRGNAVSAEEHEQQKLKLNVARNEMVQGQQSLERMMSDATLRLRETEARVHSAKTALVRAQRAIQLPTLEAQVVAAEARWKRTILTAPVAGQILRIFTYPGEELRNRPVLQMGETQRMYAVAEVYETSVRHVRVGQKVTVTSPALERTLTGKVERIGQRIYKNDVLGVDPKAETDSRVVEIRVRLDESSLASHYNYLQVDVSIDRSIPEEASEASARLANGNR